LTFFGEAVAFYYLKVLKPSPFNIIGLSNWSVIKNIIFLGGILISRFDKMTLADSIYCAFSTAFKAGFGNMTSSPEAELYVEC